jgi:hypothetical protein
MMETEEMDCLWHPNFSMAVSKQTYTVEKIVDHRVTRAPGLMYRVRWKGYSESDDTWERADGMDNCRGAVKAYWKRWESGDAPSDKCEKTPPRSAITEVVGARWAEQTFVYDVKMRSGETAVIPRAKFVKHYPDLVVRFYNECLVSINED